MRKRNKTNQPKTPDKTTDSGTREDRFTWHEGDVRVISKGKDTRKEKP